MNDPNKITRSALSPRTRARHPVDPQLRGTLRALRPGQRVRYFGWRGPRDLGEGIFLGWRKADGKMCEPAEWGYNKSDGVVVKRDCSADDGRTFLCFVGDGESVEALSDHG